MRATIRRDFWYRRQQVNARSAIFHQWQQLETYGCIENFRIAAGLSSKPREGQFFADSDAYKWLDAAARILRDFPDPRLAELVDGFIALLAKAQMLDGYIFTYNQVHFPGVRWHNLQIEHELYCHGHLIEAGVSHYQASGRTDLLAVAKKAADRIVSDYRGKGTDFTPGHEEIELALLRLYEVTGQAAYFELARQFVEQRGRNPLFALSILRQFNDSNQRGEIVKQQIQAYQQLHPEFKAVQFPAGNLARAPRNARQRWYLSALGGKYFQQHAPIRKQTVPVGHSVRFGYLKTAAAWIARLTGDDSLLPGLEKSWQHMVTRRMFVTGGLGALAELEGFGNDDELDPEYAYCEPCAALASLMWNWEMAQITGSAQYSDLFEWQLYNAASVGMGAEGTSYLYNNPLVCRGGVTRKAWFWVPCCPSNLSRIWADVGGYIYSARDNNLTVHQYISSELDEGPLRLSMQAGLPWQGQVRIEITAVESEQPVRLLLRRPSWVDKMRVRVNQEIILPDPAPAAQLEPTDAGYDPRNSTFLTIERAWQVGDVIEIDFDLPVRLLRTHPRVQGHAGKVTVTRGPLVYCLESVDNMGVDIFTAQVDAGSLAPVEDASLLGGIIKLVGKTVDGQPLTFIPYYLWANRGESQMTVWVKEIDQE